MKLKEQYTGEELTSFIGKRMKMICVDGEVIKGEVYGYTSKYDSCDGQIHVFIYSPRMGFGVDVAEDEIVQFVPTGEKK